MLTQEEENDNEVRREDQENINLFGRLNAKLYEIRAERDDYKKHLERLEDASAELMMMDDSSSGSCLLRLGDAFFETTEESATDFCENEADRLQNVIELLEEEEAKILEEQAKLKVVLYGRFGKSINLEDK